MLQNGSWCLGRMIPLDRRMVNFILKLVHVKKLSISYSCHPFDLSSFVVGSDCGVFVSMFSYFISIDCSLVFDQDHIDHCRNIIALSIMDNCARTQELRFQGFKILLLFLQLRYFWVQNITVKGSKYYSVFSRVLNITKLLFLDLQYNMVQNITKPVRVQNITQCNPGFKILQCYSY